MAVGIMVLAGCTDPVLVGLTGPADAPTALIDPCRTDWFSQHSLTVIDVESRVVLWRVESKAGTRVDMRSVTFGTQPEGTTTSTPASALAGHTKIQWAYDSPNSEPILQTFAVSEIDPRKVLTTDGVKHSPSGWEACTS